jgi:hypothetical protein
LLKDEAVPAHTSALAFERIGQIDATGVDEIQYAKGHKYLALVYQISMAAALRTLADFVK